MDRQKVSRDHIHRSLNAYGLAGPTEHAAVRTAQDAGFEDEHFHVGDEVISRCGSVAGVILSMQGDAALVSWSCRGKSVEPVQGLSHIEHDNGV